MKWLVLILSLCSITPCLARVDINSTKPLLIPVDNVTQKITQKDVAEVIPTDMQASSDSGSIFSRIADRGFSYWYNNSGFKQSSVGRVAESAQEKLKTDVIVPASSAKGTSHKFSFKVQAFQAMAKMEYTGWIKANVDYSAPKGQTEFSVHEKIWKNKDLVVSHAISAREGNNSSMGVRWSW